MNLQVVEAKTHPRPSHLTSLLPLSYFLLPFDLHTVRRACARSLWLRLSSPLPRLVLLLDFILNLLRSVSHLVSGDRSALDGRRARFWLRDLSELVHSALVGRVNPPLVDEHEEDYVVAETGQTVQSASRGRKWERKGGKADPRRCGASG